MQICEGLYLFFFIKSFYKMLIVKKTFTTDRSKDFSMLTNHSFQISQCTLVNNKIQQKENIPCGSKQTNLVQIERYIYILCAEIHV